MTYLKVSTVSEQIAYLNTQSQIESDLYNQPLVKISNLYIGLSNSDLDRKNTIPISFEIVTNLSGNDIDTSSYDTYNLKVDSYKNGRFSTNLISEIVTIDHSKPSKLTYFVPSNSFASNATVQAVVSLTNNSKIITASSSTFRIDSQRIAMIANKPDVLGINVPNTSDSKTSIGTDKNLSTYLAFPNSKKLTLEENTVIINLPTEKQSKVTKYTAEVSIDGESYEQVYSGKSNILKLDLSKIQKSGDYFLKILLEYEDGTTEIFQYEDKIQIEIEKDNATNEEKENNKNTSNTLPKNALTITNITPADGAKITTRAPVISGEVIILDNILDSLTYKDLKVELFINSNESGQLVQLNKENIFSYTPTKELSTGDQTILVKIQDKEGDLLYEKKWSFTINEESNSITAFINDILEDRSKLLWTILTCIALIFIISLALFAFTRNRRYDDEIIDEGMSTRSKNEK